MARLASALCWAQLALAGKPQVAYGTQAELAAVVDGLGVEAQRQTVAAVLGAIAVGDEASVDLAPADARRRAAAREAARVLLEGEMLEWLMMTDEQVARALQPGALQPEPARRSDDRTLGGGTLAPAVAANTASVVAGYPRQLQGGGGGSDICPSPDSASLVASTREHRQLNFTGDYTAAGQPLCSWRIECEPGTKDPAVLLRFHSLSTYYGGDATPPLGAGDAVRVYPDPDQDDYVELMGPLSAQPSSFGVPFEQSFGAAGGTMRVELSFAWGQTAGFAADYWCVSAHVLEPGCTDSAANNFDASANADDGSCDYGDVPALLSAAFQVDPAGQMPYGWGTDNDPCVSGVPDCEGWQGVFCHKFTMGETTASRPVWVTPGWREDVSLTVGDDIGRLHSLMQVDLSNSGLHGVLTESLGGMRALNSLSLWGTALSGTMPDGIGGLNQLQTLDLDATRLSGTIPGAIGQLASLKMLQLYDTQLSGSMPTELLELKGLEQLSLSRCKISGSLANSISGMESLNTLHMANCRLTGSLPSSLGDMAALQDLDLSGTNIDGTIPTEVGRMSSLRTLALSHTRISGVLMPELAMVTGLESLDLGHTATSGTLIDELGDMKSLEVLGLGSTHITGTLIDALSGMTALEQFSMATTGINGTIPKSLLSLTQLQRVQLQDTGLSGTLPPAIHSWTAMKILDLPNCHLSGTIPSGVGSMTALTELSLHSNFMSGTLPAEINLLANLKSLYLNTMELSGPLPDMSGCVGLRVLRLTNNSFTALPPALPPNVTHVYLDQQPMNATGDALCQLKPQSVQVLSIAFSAVPILLEATDGPECHLDGGCRGTWVTPPSSCRIGQDCNWHLELRDALDEAATVGGRMHNLFIGYNCSDTERRNSCAVVEPMVDNRNGTFTATVPGDRDTGRPWIDPDRPWIEMQGKHHFSFFHEEHGFFPSTDGDGGHSAIVAVQLNTTTFLPRECPDAHTVADTTTGSVCVCEGPSAKAPQGFHRGNRLGQSSCEINCPLGQQTRDGSTCECADGYYNPELAGTVACVLQDWPPTPVAWSSARERYDGSALITDYGEAKCLPCPHDCATCKDGSINSMAGWRLNGTVDSKDLSERLMLFQPRGANVLYRCPNGSSYGSVLSNESSFTVCPSLPLDNTALHDVRIHTTCQLERVGPLCQSCGPDSLADGDGLCGPCPKYDTDLYGKCAGLALVAGLVLVALLYLVSWTREDTKVANEMISTMAELSRTLSNQTSLNSQTSSLNSQTSLNSQDSVNSTRYKISLEQPLTSLDSDGLRREPSVGMPELFEEQRANVERDHQAMRTVCMQLAFQSARILISYAQVVTQLGAVLHVQLPPVFENAIDKLKVLTVDMSAFLRLHDVHFMDCLSVYQRWEVYVGIVPVVMLAIVLLLHIVDKWRGLESVADKSKIRSYFILFLVYPSVCRESFSLFNCRKLGEGYRVLLEDYDLDCDDEDYTTYRHIAMLVIVVFIAGVPVGLFYLLWRKIRATRRQELEEEYIIASLAREGRELLGTFSKETAKDVLQTVQAGQTSFFAAGYKGRYYFWESLDMCRKLLLVGMIIFAGQGSTAQCSLAVLLSFLFFAAQVGYAPCKLDADNQLRAVSEAHIFLTCLVSLALKTPLVTENFKATDYGAVLYVTLVGLLLHAVWCVYSKIKEARGLLSPKDGGMAEKGTRREKSLRDALKLHNLGFGDSQGVLAKRVDRLRDKYREEQISNQLSSDDKRKLAWIKEELGLEDLRKGIRKASHTDLMEESCKRLNLHYEVSDKPSDTVRSISDAIVARVRREEQDGVFLSHFQANAGPDVMELKGQLEREHPELVGKIWYDKDNNPSIEGMRNGVRDHRYFLAYLTRDYLMRPFCRKEIRWALMYRKTIVLLWKREGGGAVGRFNDFFMEADQSIEIMGQDDGGGGDLTEIFGDAAINYYTDGPFHAASMVELSRRLGHEVGAAIGTSVYEFPADGPPPRILLAFSKADGQAQVQTIERELSKIAPELTDESFGLLDVDQLNIEGATAVVVYMTESIFASSETDMGTGGGSGLLEALEHALRSEVRVVLVAETDMAHGWSEFAKQFQNSDWSDGVNHLKSQIPVEYFEAQGGLTLALFDGVIPFYKDLAFKNVSLQCILEAAGAEQTLDDELADISVELMASGSGVSQSSAGSAGSYTGGSPNRGSSNSGSVRSTRSISRASSFSSTLGRTYTAKLRSTEQSSPAGERRSAEQLSPIGWSRPASPEMAGATASMYEPEPEPV